MQKIILSFLLFLSVAISQAQSNLTIETLWSLGRVAYRGENESKTKLFYSVSKPNINDNKNSTKYYSVSLQGTNLSEIASLPAKEKVNVANNADNVQISPDGKKVIFSREVKLQKLHSTELYPSLSKSNVYIYNDLNQRHWDTWEDGSYSHVFVADNVAGTALREKDLMQSELFDCPQKPFGGAEDMIWTPDSKNVLYVCKKKTGKEYALSTNTDFYVYNIENGYTTNITEGMMGYDTHPVFSNYGKSLAWLSMKTDGFESDKNELWVMDWTTKNKINLTENWDENVDDFVWSADDSKIYFSAPVHGTQQLFEIEISTKKVKQITAGMFNIAGLCMQNGNEMIVSRTDMNHAAELYNVNLNNGNMTQISHANDAQYSKINMCEVRERYTELEDGEQLFSWVIYPPNFDPNKKYPVLLYCQGGPQSALSQFYSFRWNFQLMASKGYIVIAPNRTGMPGWGTAWNADISKDWGGNPMRDYLAAIDDISTEKYIDVDRRGAVGASYGGYSIYMLAGIHEGRFKTFIAHDGLFDLKSWYGTTEELWFANWDIGGAYWDTKNKAAQNSYKNFNPSNYVDNWTTPIMIIQGGIDFRVPIEQGMQAFQAAQLKGLKSRLIYLPEENHWVLQAQNGIVWQNEFFKWLSETL